MTAKLIYIRYRNFCNSLLRKLEIDYYKNQIDKDGNNPKSIWK